MSFVYDQKVVDSMYGSHVVSMAVDYGVDLVKMWPLQTNQNWKMTSNMRRTCR